MAKTPLELAEGIGKHECCGNCRFWDPFPSDVKEASLGKCRRYPPAAGMVEDKTSLGPKYYLPVVMVGDWCGEHQPQEKKREPFRETMVRKA